MPETEINNSRSLRFEENGSWEKTHRRREGLDPNDARRRLFIQIHCTVSAQVKNCSRQLCEEVEIWRPCRKETKTDENFFRTTMRADSGG